MAGTSKKRVDELNRISHDWGYGEGWQEAIEAAVKVVPVFSLPDHEMAELRKTIRALKRPPAPVRED